MKTILELICRNPFSLLELSRGATAIEIERQGRKILGLLELNANDGQHFESPCGIETRDSSDVRQAMAALRDPAQFEFYSFWAIQEKQSETCRNVTGRDASKEPVNYLAASGFLP